jgi:hypothetical protein
MCSTMVQDGMKIDWDADIPVDDGIVLKCDVFRPISGEPCPVLLTYGPYAKGLCSPQDGRGGFRRYLVLALLCRWGDRALPPRVHSDLRGSAYRKLPNCPSVS